MADVAQDQAHQFSFHNEFETHASMLSCDEGLYSNDDSSGCFSFPSKPAARFDQKNIQTPANFDVGNVPRTHTRANNSLSALPAFSFNPGQVSRSLDQATEWSSIITTSAPTTPAKTGRHRRSASELIGSNTRIGNDINRNGSPNQPWKAELHATTLTPFGSLPSRIEYRHQRTDTACSQDTKAIGQRPTFGRNLSSPSSSSATAQTELTSQGAHRSDSAALPLSSSPFGKPRAGGNDVGGGLTQAPRSPNRHRVGFSDTLEFIPRPLSTISSESGSSMSTIRAHSMSGSISSVLCSGASSPLSKNIINLTNRKFDIAEIPSKAQSVSSPPEAVSTGTYTHSKYNDDDLSQRSVLGAAAPVYSFQNRLSSTRSQDHGRTYETRANPPPSELQKQRRTGSWTSLLGRRSKTDLTAPVPLATAEVVESMGPSSPVVVELSEDFDTDPTSMIVSDSHARGSSASTPPVTPPITPSGRKMFCECSNSLGNTNMIDLDAALASELSHDGRGPKGRSFSEARRSMHSNALSTGLSNTSAHRRAESAPSSTSVVFDASGFRERNASVSSFKRPQMDDVFEEDEDESPPKASHVESSSQGEGLAPAKLQDTYGANTADFSSVPTTPSEIAITSTCLDFAAQNMRFDAPWNGPWNSREDTGSYTGSEPLDTSQNDGLFSDTSIVTRHSGNYVKQVTDGTIPKHRRSAGSDTFPLPNRFASVPTIHTSSSLVFTNCGCGNDCSAYSQKDASDGRKPFVRSIGERGSDLRYSVDDVPSLISSGSTVISNVHVRAPSSSRSFAPRSTCSSLSLSSGTEQRRKRSSIVSFSRFVGGTFTDRSRATLEPGKRWQTPLEAEDHQQQKHSRLSRILKFLKPNKVST